MLVIRLLSPKKGHKHPILKSMVM